MPTVIIHILNEDPVVGEIDQMFAPQDNLIILKNPRRRDGKDIHYIEPSVNVVVWPMTRINFIELMPSEKEEDLISFVRE